MRARRIPSYVRKITLIARILLGQGLVRRGEGEGAVNPGGRIIGVVSFGEIPGALPGRRHSDRPEIVKVSLAVAFVVIEEEGLLATDRPSHSKAKLVLLGRSFGLVLAVGEEIRRVHRAVAQELEGFSMKLVRARARDHRKKTAGRPAVLRRHAVRDELEFLDRGKRRVTDKVFSPGIVFSISVGNPVVKHLGRTLASPINVAAPHIATGVDAIHWRDAVRKQLEVHDAAALER